MEGRAGDKKKRKKFKDTRGGDKRIKEVQQIKTVQQVDGKRSSLDKKKRKSEASTAVAFLFCFGD